MPRATIHLPRSSLPELATEATVSCTLLLRSQAPLLREIAGTLPAVTHTLAHLQGLPTQAFAFCLFASRVAKLDWQEASYIARPGCLLPMSVKPRLQLTPNHFRLRFTHQ